MFWAAVIADVVLFGWVVAIELLVDRVQDRASNDRAGLLDRVSSYLQLSLFVPPLVCLLRDRHGPAWVVLVLSLLLMGLLAYIPALDEARFRRLQRRKRSAGVRFWVKRIVLKSGEVVTERELGKEENVFDGPVPVVGDRLTVTCRGRTFEANVIWGNWPGRKLRLNPNKIVPLRVQEV